MSSWGMGAWGMGDGGHFDDDLYIIRPGLDDSGSQCHLEMSIYLVRWMCMIYICMCGRRLYL